MPRVIEVKKLFVCLDYDQHNALEIFTVKRNITSDISWELLNDIFAEVDGSIRIKNITDMLNLGELQAHDVSAKLTTESTKKYIPIM